MEKSDGDDDEGDDLDDDQFDEEEGDNELDGHAASSGIGEASSMLDGVTNREEDAQREVQQQRNLEQALLIQMEMQKKLHEQLEVSLLYLCNQHCRPVQCCDAPFTHPNQPNPTFSPAACLSRPLWHLFCTLSSSFHGHLLKSVCMGPKYLMDGRMH